MGKRRLKMSEQTKIYSRLAIKLRQSPNVSLRVGQYLGDDYVIVPATALVEGVHVGHVNNANVDAVFFPKEALKTNLDEWNTRPITLGHAKDESGQIVFPDSPQILEKFQTGLIFNPRLENMGKNLALDVWFKSSRLNDLAPSLLEKIKRGEEVDVSADLNIDGVIQPGVFNGEKYDAIAKVLHPKGLSILENEKGACSFMDGCGIRNRACNKNKGCTECKNNTLEDKMGEEERNKTPGQDGAVDCSKDGNILRSFMVAMTSILGQKNASGAEGGCGCAGDKGKGSGEPAKNDDPPKPQTMEQFLATAPEEIKTTLTTALASAKAAEDAKEEKLKGLRTEILALDKTFTEEGIGKMDEAALTTLKTALSKKPATDFSLGAGAWGDNTVIDDEVLEAPDWPKADAKTN
jgi:hypothetical protein